MAKKQDSFLDEMLEKGERRAKRTAKQKVKKLHPLTKFLAVLFLLIGVGLGVLACTFFSKNDRFVLKGDTQFSIDAGTAFVYEEQGVEAVAFGLSCESKVKVEAKKASKLNLRLKRIFIPDTEIETVSGTYRGVLMDSGNPDTYRLEVKEGITQDFSKADVRTIKSLE